MFRSLFWTGFDSLVSLISPVPNVTLRTVSLQNSRSLSFMSFSWLFIWSSCLAVSCWTRQLQGRVETQHLPALAALALLAPIVENETLLWLHLRLKHHEGSATLFLRSFPAVALLTIYTDNDDTWSRCVEHDRSFRSVHPSGNRKTRFTLTRTTEQWHRCTKLRSKRSIGRHCTVPHVFTVSNELSVVRAQELNRV